SVAGPRLALAILGAAVLLGALTSAALAFTQRGHSFGFQFSSKAEQKQCKKAPGTLGCLSDPAGVAVSESTGDVYVVDAGNQRVEHFNAKGEALEVWGWGVKNGAAELQQCKTGETCQVGSAGTGEAQFDYPTNSKGKLAVDPHERAAIGIAVDNSAGSPSKGDVYVVSNTLSEHNVVEKFSAT